MGDKPTRFTAEYLAHSEAHRVLNPKSEEDIRIKVLEKEIELMQKEEESARENRSFDRAFDLNRCVGTLSTRVMTLKKERNIRNER